MRRRPAILIVLAAASAATAQVETVKLPDKAVDVTPGKSVSHTFARTGDVVWLKFPVDKPGSLSYLAFGQHKDRATSVALFDAKGRRVGSGDPKWIGYYDVVNFAQLWTARVGAGVHYLRLTCAHGSGSFRMSIDLEPADGDDTPAKARPIAVDKPLSMRIAPAGDVDHFRFTVAKTGWAVVRRLGRYKQAPVDALKFALTDAKGEPAADPTRASDASGQLYFAAAVEPGKYVLAVSGEPFATRVQLRLELIEGRDPLEAGDSAKYPRIVGINRMLAGRRRGLAELQRPPRRRADDPSARRRSREHVPQARAHHSRQGCRAEPLGESRLRRSHPRRRPRRRGRLPAEALRRAAGGSAPSRAAVPSRRR
jgi:hypothetical protein